MKPLYKAIVFLVILTVLDFLLRKGFIAFFIPFQLPHNLNALLLYSLFALISWLLSYKFCLSEQIKLQHLGVSLNSKNRRDFVLGFFIGLLYWAIVSVVQSYTAGFNWELRDPLSLFNLLYGLLFIFIADLGTELFTRAYPLRKFEEALGSKVAIVLMVFFVGIKSYSFQANGELLFYTIAIPALHTIFFSFIYFKTKRLGASLGIHTGANFVTLSVFDLRIEQVNQSIPSGIFQSSVELEKLSLNALQLPWVFAAVLFSIATYFWWAKTSVKEVK